jgi:hypothetical protein
MEPAETALPGYSLASEIPLGIPRLPSPPVLSLAQAQLPGGLHLCQPPQQRLTELVFLSGIAAGEPTWKTDRRPQEVWGWESLESQMSKLLLSQPWK